VQLSTCAGTAAQMWSYFANEQLRGQSGNCLTNNGDGTLSATVCGPDTSNTVTNLYQPLPTQRFAQRSSATFQWSSGTNFSDADVGTNSSSYETLRITNVDSDGWNDACIRLPTGLTCGLNNHATLGAYTDYSAAFSDANGWVGDAYGSTVQLADVNGDGINDACGRSTTGIECAIGTGSGFAPPAAWTTDFSDSTVFAGAAYYRSIHLADINGDSYADICGRSTTGIVCALNTKSGAFAPSTAWISTDFTDALGWSADAYASTIQLADINGDHRADVCGRGPNGIMCAISDGSATFYDDHVWSFRTNFSDGDGWNASASYYGSIHFGDVNGDGLADVCGRAPTGIVCALSDADGFEELNAVQTSNYTDALGWESPAYGVSVQVADINHDGHADVCGRSSAGLVCTYSP
jgi:hypothetical protein